eukprot:5857954-Pleurochrysis_carterae.AAC.4
MADAGRRRRRRRWRRRSRKSAAEHPCMQLERKKQHDASAEDSAVCTACMRAPWVWQLRSAR